MQLGRIVFTGENKSRPMTPPILSPSPRRFRRLAAVLACIALLPHGAAASDEILRVDGAASVAMAIFGAVQVMRTEQGMEIDISANRGSAGGIEAVGNGEADVAMSSRAVTPEDRAACPSAMLKSTYIGHQVVALVVTKAVHEGGIKALSPVQVRAIYEGRAKNWKEFGGPDVEIKFFNPTPGRGVWEVFTEWVYGDNRRAGFGKADHVKTNSEALNMLAFVKGALTVLPPSLIPKDEAFAVATVEKDGTPVEPTPQNIVSGKYSMARPMLLVTDQRPVGLAKKFIDFILGERGQEILRQEGHMTLKEVKAAGGGELLSLTGE
jgi:phosphate transport system substrate-binding protein